MHIYVSLDCDFRDTIYLYQMIQSFTNLETSFIWIAQDKFVQNVSPSTMKITAICLKQYCLCSLLLYRSWLISYSSGCLDTSSMNSPSSQLSGRFDAIAKQILLSLFQNVNLAQNGGKAQEFHNCDVTNLCHVLCSVDTIPFVSLVA